MEYSGIKIYDRVIIVTNPHNQGYIVEPGNENMLESAKAWAGGWNYKSKPKPNSYEYENGKFTLELEDAAENSYGQGKLSFWNCKITAPDGKSFLIGINAENLCSLMKSNTFINGKCSNNIWLGRTKQQCAFTENMKEFESAKNDLKLKDEVKSKTTKYVAGNIVGSLTKRYIYLGEFNCWSDRTNHYVRSWKDLNVVYIKKIPEKVHLYINEDEYERFLSGIRPFYAYEEHIRKKKASMHLFSSDTIDGLKQFHTGLNAGIDKVKQELTSENTYFCQQYCFDTIKDAQLHSILYTPLDQEVDLEDLVMQTQKIYDNYYNAINEGTRHYTRITVKLED